EAFFDITLHLFDQIRDGLAFFIITASRVDPNLLLIRAQRLVDRQVERLPDDVPDRYVNCAHRADVFALGHRLAVLAVHSIPLAPRFGVMLIHPTPEAPDEEGILAANPWQQLKHNNLMGAGGDAAPDDPLVGVALNWVHPGRATAALDNRIAPPRRLAREAQPQ